MKRNLELLDVVELLEARGGRPAGAVGTVVELFPAEALVEFVDEGGATIALLNVPVDAVRVRSSEPSKRHAAG
jgi:hypothetical protein